MDKSESIKEIAGALCKAQGDMQGAKKDSSNPFFKSSYADLSSVVEALKIPFSDNGLSYTQAPIYENNMVGVETLLMHVSGEYISSVLMLPVDKQTAQAVGSALTYARRYALQAMAGIPSEDDDGNAASEQVPKPVKTEYPIDSNARGWVAAAKQDITILDRITDVTYREFIRKEALK